MEALERIGSPDAQQVLETLGQGAPDARQTREVKAALESEGTEFYPNGEKFCGIWQEATADLAKKDWKLEQQMRCWGVIWIACTRSIFDLALLYFAYQAYTADNLKILIVLGLWLVLRRLDLKAAGNTFAHELALDRLKMVSPDAEETYFTAKNWKHFEECKRRVEKFLTLEEQTQEQELAQPRRRNRDDELPWLEDRRKQTLRELGGR